MYVSPGLLDPGLSMLFHDVPCFKAPFSHVLKGPLLCYTTRSGKLEAEASQVFIFSFVVRPLISLLLSPPRIGCSLLIPPRIVFCLPLTPRIVFSPLSSQDSDFSLLSSIQTKCSFSLPFAHPTDTYWPLNRIGTGCTARGVTTMGKKERL